MELLMTRPRWAIERSDGVLIFRHRKRDLPIVRRWEISIGDYWRGFFLFSQKNKDGKMELGTLGDAQGSHSNQFRGLSPVMQCRYIAMVLLTASVWPSIWGWNAELNLSITSASLNKSRHMCPVKSGSRSLIIEAGIPCSHTISEKNSLARIWVA